MGVGVGSELGEVDGAGVEAATADGAAGAADDAGAAPPAVVASAAGGAVDGELVVALEQLAISRPADSALAARSLSHLPLLATARLMT